MEICSVFVVYVVIWVQVDGLVVTFDGLVEFSKFYLCEGSIVIEEVVWWACFQCQVIGDYCLFIFFKTQAHIPIIS